MPTRRVSRRRPRAPKGAQHHGMCQGLPRRGLCQRGLHQSPQSLFCPLAQCARGQSRLEPFGLRLFWGGRPPKSLCQGHVCFICTLCGGPYAIKREMVSRTHPSGATLRPKGSSGTPGRALAHQHVPTLPPTGISLSPIITTRGRHPTRGWGGPWRKLGPEVESLPPCALRKGAKRFLKRVGTKSP